MGLFDRLGGDSSRVAFLGVDGVPFELVDGHPDVFPNLHEIAEDGDGGRISSIVPPESSACWPALTTGRNPGGTGVYGFQDRERGSYDTYVPLSHHVEAERVWDRATMEGLDATVLNVPVTYPPSDSVQRMVSGFLSPGVEDAASDDDVLEVLKEHGYRVDVDASLGHEDDKTEFVEDAHETLDARQRVFRHYVEADDWDLFFGVYMTSDRVNHFLYGDYVDNGEYREEFLEFYRKLDRYIGELREAFADDVSLIVASDHGFTKLEREANCNEWLRRNGWLDFDLEEDVDEDSQEEKVDGLDDIADTARAYSFIPGRFYLNLEGREPRGSVSEDEYGNELAKLESDLEGWMSDDGRRVCRRLVRGSEVFDGDHDDIAPDLVAIPEDGFDLKSKFGGSREVFEKGPRNGMHKFENAVLYTDDPGMEVGDDVDLLDIAPTLLELLDVGEEDLSLDGESLASS